MGGNNPGEMTFSTNSRTEQHLVEGYSIIFLAGSEAGDMERDKHWQAKLALGGNNNRATKTKTNLKTEQHFVEGYSRIRLEGSESGD